MTDVADQDLPLPCPHCGYDLRGNATGICPECGGAFDAATLQAAAPLPWNDRPRIGLARAFVRQVSQSIRRPRELATLVGRPVDYAAARRFHLLCALVGGVGLAVPLLVAFVEFRPNLLDPPATFWAGFSYATPPTPADYLLDGLIGLALAVGGFLFLLAATGLATYFCHPRDLPRARQNSAVALCHFAAAAPLVLLPLVAVLLLTDLALGHAFAADPQPLPLRVALGGCLLLSLLTLLVTLALVLRGSWVLLRRGLHRGVGRAILMTLVTLVGGTALFALFVVGLPLLTWWAECVALTLLR